MGHWPDCPSAGPESQQANCKFRLFLKCLPHYLWRNCRAVDPDPHSFSLLDPDPDLHSICGSRKTTLNYSNLHKLHLYLLLSNLLFFSHSFWSWIRIQPGSAFKMQLNPDPHWEKLLDPDSQEMIADPKPFARKEDSWDNWQQVAKCNLFEVSCDGGGGALGHPKVFINLDPSGPQSCIYCGLRFEMDHSHAHHH